MQTVFDIPGIHCEACASLIKDVSGDFPDIQSVAVDTASKKVTLTHSDTFAKESWIAAIEELGETYNVKSAS